VAQLLTGSYSFVTFHSLERRYHSNPSFAAYSKRYEVNR